MKAHRVTLTILNFENSPEAEVQSLVSYNKYLNLHLDKFETFDVGEWSDEHPLNQLSTNREHYFNELKKTST